MSDKNYTPDIFGYIENMKDLNAASQVPGRVGSTGVRMMTSFALKTATEFSEGCASQISNNTKETQLRVKELEDKLEFSNKVINDMWYEAAYTETLDKIYTHYERVRDGKIVLNK